MAAPDGSPDVLIARARGGDDGARARLLEMYLEYVRLQAQVLLGPGLRARLDPSDVVQETFLAAHRDFDSFRGVTESHLIAWLRRILVRTLADLARHHTAEGRDVRRQESLEAMLDRASDSADRALAADFSTPSAAAVRREQGVVVADALARLRPDDREVLVLRHLEGMKFDEIAARMVRSPGAVRVLWTRALERLHQVLEGAP